jgi:methylenetetrahydrofolate--tRNA-(uracil-5-)-methyltransferase
MRKQISIVGGGLAGCEAAWQAAEKGIEVRLYEMRPINTTGAHRTDQLAELVCSNSFGSRVPDRSSGMLIEELRMLNSIVLQCAEEVAIPAGNALAVDRIGFSTLVTEKITGHPRIELIRQEIQQIPDGETIIASGPLTSDMLTKNIVLMTGEGNLSFFDAIAPVIYCDSINFDIAFRGSRYNHGVQEEGDYINCPLNESQYKMFIAELVQGKRIEIRDFESAIPDGVKAGVNSYFEGCLPVEILASRGEKSLAFGPMRPIGLFDPRTDKRPYAVVQLRQDNFSGDLYNIVGFQTNLTFPEQERVLRLIPGLEKAEFMRFGQMHRNTYIASPKLLLPTLHYHNREYLFFAGQITGIEGYLGNIGSGLVAGVNMANHIHQDRLMVLPKTTMLGALIQYITHAEVSRFQPMKANFGILPDLGAIKAGKRERATAHRLLGISDLKFYLSQ